MSFGMIILNQSIKTKQIDVSWIQVASFVVNIKTKGVYKDIANDVESRFNTSNYELVKIK